MPRFHARPTPPKPVHVIPKQGTPINDDVAKALNAVLENQANVIGLLRAVLTSINRAQGAAVAQELNYEKLQMKNARKYAGKIVLPMKQSAELRKTASRKLRENGAVFTIDEDAAYNIREFLLDKGLSSSFKRILSRYCRNKSESDEVQLSMVSQLTDVHRLEVTFPDVFSNRKVALAENSAASVLKNFSEST